MDESIIECYRKAGETARRALKLAYDIVSPARRIKLLDLCDRIEKYVLHSGAKLPFPCNISLNEVAAHDTPLYEKEIIFDKGLFKIDVGAMVDGYIADNAITIARGYEYESISKINEEILNEIIPMFRPGMSLGYIGKYVELEASRHNYKPISNLTGHLIDRYRLHAGKSVPNVSAIFAHKINEFEVYAVEPFLTFKEGEGKVVEKGNTKIFSLIKVKKIKDKRLNELKNYIYGNYKLLPFTPRWLYDKYGDETSDLVYSLVKIKYLRKYPVLVEKKHKYVSQFEHTIIVTDSEPIIITK